MIRRPPKSTLFPATPLCRSQAHVVDRQRSAQQLDRRIHERLVQVFRQPLEERPEADRAQIRSEEHTSELQSRQYLVCRLLLEKKQTMNYTASLLYFSLTRLS